MKSSFFMKNIFTRFATIALWIGIILFPASIAGAFMGFYREADILLLISAATIFISACALAGMKLYEKKGEDLPAKSFGGQAFNYISHILFTIFIITIFILIFLETR